MRSVSNRLSPGLLVDIASLLSMFVVLYVYCGPCLLEATLGAGGGIDGTLFLVTACCPSSLLVLLAGLVSDGMVVVMLLFLLCISHCRCWVMLWLSWLLVGNSITVK